MRMAAALAFYTIFSLAPILLIAVSIAAPFVGKPAAWLELSSTLERELGPEVTGFVVSTLHAWSSRTSGTAATLIAVAVMLFGATVVFGELKSGLNEIWNAKPSNESFLVQILHGRLLSFLAVLAAGVLLIASVMVSTAVSTVSEFLTRFLVMPHFVLQGTNFFVAFCLLTLLFAILYKLLPDVEISWRDVGIGALLTSALVMLGKYLIGLYLSNWILDSVYGAAGSLVILLAWVYYSSMVILFGAELTRAYAVRRGPAIPPEATKSPTGDTGLNRRKGPPNSSAQVRRHSVMRSHRRTNKKIAKSSHTTSRNGTNCGYRSSQSSRKTGEKSLLRTGSGL